MSMQIYRIALQRLKIDKNLKKSLQFLQVLLYNAIVVFG